MPTTSGSITMVQERTQRDPWMTPNRGDRARITRDLNQRRFAVRSGSSLNSLCCGWVPQLGGGSVAAGQPGVERALGLMKAELERDMKCQNRRVSHR